METQSVSVLGMAHLVVLALWGGVVATEAVVEIYPFRRPELHPAAIRFHYVIDLLVELPLVVGVLATGVVLAFTVEPFTRLHLVKIAFGLGAIAVTLSCIAVVLRRARRLRSGTEPAPLWRASRIVLACFAAGLACAAVAAVLGFGFALERVG